MQIITAEKVSRQIASLMDLLEKNPNSEDRQWILRSLAFLPSLHAMVIANSSCGITLQIEDLEFNNLLGHVFNGCDGVNESCQFAALMMLEKLQGIPGFDEKDARNGNVLPSTIEKWGYLSMQWRVLFDFPSIEALK